jgi:hypothetical protein
MDRDGTSCLVRSGFASGAAGAPKFDASSRAADQLFGFGGRDIIDPSDISFGAPTTLGDLPNHNNSGGTLMVNDGLQSASLALLRQYMAGSFATASDGHGDTLITDPPPASQHLLSQPHA